MKITENNKVEIQKLADQAVEKALEICGIKAEGYAANLCPVDTGLLRNSITSAVGGKAPTKSSYSADKGKGKKDALKGSYTGQEAPDTGTPYVVVGTNVEYAPKIELSDKEFLRPAIEDHIGEYNDVLKKELENG
jgi:hypothetical protein